jgi:hypothetical protein
MPDLMTETRRTCESNLHWQKQYPSTSQPDVTYTVCYGPVSGGAYSHDYTCDCPAGSHGRHAIGKDLCRHVTQAIKDRCGWGMEAFAGGNPIPNANMTCPRCGGATGVIRIGV